MEERRQYDGYAALPNVAAMLTLIDQVKTRAYGLPGLACYSGPSGYGKTTACIMAMQYFKAVHIELKSLWRTKTMLQQIVLELGHKPKPTTADLFEQAARELGRARRPLIIDEADHAVLFKNGAMLDVLRGLHDSSGVPVILVGEELLPSKLQRWERVHGRVMKWVQAERATQTDVGLLIPIYAPDIQIAADLREPLLQASGGSIRYVVNNLAEMQQTAHIHGLTTLTAKDWARIGNWFTGAPPLPRREEMTAQQAVVAMGRAASRRQA